MVEFIVKMGVGGKSCILEAMIRLWVTTHSCWINCYFWEINMQ